MASSARKGFTLIEVVLVVSVLTILIGATIWSLPSGLVSSGQSVAASNHRLLLDAAREAYADIDDGAAAAWAAAENDTEKITLLIAANLLNGTPASNLSKPGGFTFQLEGPLVSATVMSKDGESE